MGNGISGTAGLGGMISFDWGECIEHFAPSQPAFWSTAIFLLALGYLLFLHFKLIRV